MRDLRQEMPKEIDLVVPALPAERRPGQRQTPVITKLFRSGSYLPMGLRLVKERAGEGAAMSVRSMGCSNGAEADSVLAHHWRSGDTRDFSITGNDISPSALEQARRGRYRVLGRGPIEALHSYGFDVEPEMQGRLRRRPMLMVDAGPVRQGYEVEFVEHDGTEPLAVTEEDDLIFANNLLYHLSDEEAIQIARNLASVLSEHGVLVLGGSSLSHDSPIDGARVSGMLNEEFGLEPLFVDSADTPVMFGRT